MSSTPIIQQSDISDTSYHLQEMRFPPPPPPLQLRLRKWITYLPILNSLRRLESTPAGHVLTPERRDNVLPAYPYGL
jgi:hypothetical protein